MTLTKTRPILLGLVAALVTLGVVGVLLLRQSGPEPIKIGAILPLSGPAQSRHWPALPVD